MQRYAIDTGTYGNGYSAEPDEDGQFVYADDAEARIAALEAQLAQYRWRRVEEEMPEDRGKVLVRFPRREEIWTRIAFYHGDGVWWSGGYTVKPIHWMPIPPAPEEGE